MPWIGSQRACAQHDGDEDDDAEDQRTGQDLDGSGAGLHGLRRAEPGAVGGDRTGGERQSVPPVPARPAGPAPHQDDGDGDQQRQPRDLQEQPGHAAAEPVGAGEQRSSAPRRRAVEAACPRLPEVRSSRRPQRYRARRGRPRPARIPTNWRGEPMKCWLVAWMDTETDATDDEDAGDDHAAPRRPSQGCGRGRVEGLDDRDRHADAPAPCAGPGCRRPACR